MNKIQKKDIRRLIGATKGRFFSLTAIVTIGVAFFVGVSSSSSVMALSVDKYDDKNNLKDITIYSNYGFDEEDLAAVKKIDGVKEAELTKFVDVLASSGTTSVVTRMHAYQTEAAINQFELIEGNLPTNQNECVVEKGSELKQGFSLGDTIHFTRPDDDLSDYLDVTSCKVVGTINSPLYLDKVKENSTLSNQYISTFIYIPEEAFKTEYYTELNVTLTDASALNSFSDEYEAYTANEKEKIETVAETQQNHRYEIVMEEAISKYNDGLKEYQDGKDEYDTKIADAKQQIEDNEKTITDGLQQIDQARIDLQSSQTELDKQKVDFATKKIELEQNIKDIDDGVTNIDQGVQSLATAKQGIQQIESMKQVLAQSNTVLGVIALYPDATTIDQIIASIQSSASLTDEQKKNTIELVQASKQILETIFSTETTAVTITNVGEFKTYLNLAISQQTTLQANLDSQINNIYKSINDGLSLTGTGNEIKTIAALDSYSATLDKTKADLLVKKQTINDGITSAEQQFKEGQEKINAGVDEVNQKSAELEDGKTKLNDAKQELEDAITDGQQELDDAKSKLDKAQQDIKDLEKGEWTVLDRTQHYSSVAYKNTIQQMEAIASIFPVFFFMVAALVCLTTMTRMVDEQRGQIGIMRALGYTQFQCAEKYLIYSSSATIFGGIIGCIVGMLIFPGIIYNAWGMMYTLPEIQLNLPWTLFILTILSFLAVMVITTWYACHKDMREVPSQLMRPKAPKLGKSTIIEKIPVIWKHLSFTWKVTVRNLLRYKRRFIMSVCGVAGCTALMITGFGIRDSIETIATKQFDDVYQYNGTITFQDSLSNKEVKEQYQNIIDNDIISNTALISTYTGVADPQGDNETVYMQIFEQPEDAQAIYHLKKRETQKELILDNDGVIINEKLAENLNKKIGDSVVIESKDGVRKEVKISGICEMYVRHYIFMTESYYQEVFGVSLADNTVALKVNGTDTENKDFQRTMAASENVKNIEFYDDLLNNFNQMIKGMDLIVVVLILSSASLAGVVLGNLTNVNVSERMREIATLKVLGFRRKEVESYIYKENNILTLIGSLVGIPLGMLLHSFIMHEVEMDYIMYGRNISVMSCVVCVAMTLAFGMIVNLMMKKTLRNIQMVESLKSVE